MNYTKEQQEVIDHSQNSNDGLIVNAYAGTGKTSTLVGIVEANPDKVFMYLAFNRAVKKEAERKFADNCKIFTMHGLAYQLFARDYYGRYLNSRLGMNLKNRDYVDMFDVKYSGGKSASFIAWAARRVLTRFKTSADSKIEEKHIDPEHVLDLQAPSAKKAVMSLAKEMWELEQDPESDFPITHDTYLKCFQLSKPDIDICDVVLLDEAQDTNPVIESIVENLESSVILVGDSFQSIYQWRGAVNSIERYKQKFKHLWLTKSFRFGSSIATLATTILKMLDDNIPELCGNEDIDSKIGGIDPAQQYTHLFRTNAELARTALNLISNGSTVYVEGGVSDLCNDLTDLYFLKNGKPKTGKSDKYRIFKNYNEILEEVEHSVEVEKDVNLVNYLGTDLLKSVDLLRNTVKDRRSVKKVDVILSTAHKSKGLEWEQVKLADDFKYITKNKSEWNLIYVAITRAMETLQVPEELYEGIKFYKEQHKEDVLGLQL